MTRPVVLVILAATLAPLTSSSLLRVEPCNPVFDTIASNRSLPHSYVDQGLESLPRIYPKHLLLVERRASQIGPVSYSMLVYQKDAGVEMVTIEGAAVHESKAWVFTAACASSAAMDGLVTTLERLAALGRQ